MAKQDNEIKEQIIAQLEKELTVKAVCARLNLSRQTVYRWMKEDKQFAKDVKDAIKSCILEINDECEARVLTKIRNDDNNMIKFWLKFHHDDYKQSYIVTR